MITVSPWLLWKTVHSGVLHCSPSMWLRGRLRMWVGVAGSYLCIMGLVYIFDIPLRSNTIHSHYDLSGDTARERHHEQIRKVADKYVKASMKLGKLSGEEEEHQRVLSSTFEKADSNGDSHLELTELTAWISKKIKEHLTLALRENFFIFTAIDQEPRNGVVSWEEYHTYFLKQHGFDDDFIKNHQENHRGLPRELKEAIMRDKAAWSEAARDNPDQLSLDEFLAFRHPESSHASILNIVEEMLSKLDLDGDGMLTEEEFSDPIMNEVPEYLTGEQFKEERQQEFQNNVDKDNNGRADRKELLLYIDPRHIHHAEKEAVNLLGAADTNGDGTLSLQEILSKKSLFLHSKMVDAARSFHDEF